MDAVDKLLRSHGALVGRILIGLLFVFSGIGIVVNGVGSLAGMIDTRGLPLAMLLAWLVVILKVVAGGALIVGYQTRWAVLGLLAFLLAVTLLYHMDLQDINLFKNLAIMGGLMYVYIYGPGPGWRLRVGETSPSANPPHMAI